MIRDMCRSCFICIVRTDSERIKNDSCGMENTVFRKRNTVFSYDRVRIVNGKEIPKEELCSHTKIA